jgi:hypothetical protein
MNNEILFFKFIEEFKSNRSFLISFQTTLISSLITEKNQKNANKVQTFQSKCIRKIIKAPFFVSNDTFHNDLTIPTVEVAKTLYTFFSLKTI